MGFKIVKSKMYFELMEVIWIEEWILEINCYILKPNTKYPLIIKYIDNDILKKTWRIQCNILFVPLDGFFKFI